MARCNATFKLNYLTKIFKMNYQTLFMLISGLLLSTKADKPTKVNFENMTEVDAEFVEFLNHFEKTELPYEVTLKDVESIKNQELDYDHEKNNFLLTKISNEDSDKYKFSRTGPPIVIPLKRFNPTANTIAVSYVIRNNFSKMFPVVMVAIYNLKGKLLSLGEGKRGKFRNTNYKIILSQNDYKQTQSFLITNNGLAQVTSYELVWKKDVSKHGTYENEITSKKLIGQETLRFQDDGKLVSIGKTAAKDVAVQMP